MNFEDNLIEYDELGFPFEAFGLNSGSDLGYNFTYKLKDTYDDADGKFSEVFGNVVIIDCNYFLD